VVAASPKATTATIKKTVGRKEILFLVKNRAMAASLLQTIHHKQTSLSINERPLYYPISPPLDKACINIFRIECNRRFFLLSIWLFSDVIISEGRGLNEDTMHQLWSFDPALSRDDPIEGSRRLMMSCICGLKGEHTADAKLSCTTPRDLELTPPPSLAPLLKVSILQNMFHSSKFLNGVHPFTVKSSR
jgi:hypothetical protein